MSKILSQAALILIITFLSTRYSAQMTGQWQNSPVLLQSFRERKEERKEEVKERTCYNEQVQVLHGEKFKFPQSHWGIQLHRMFHKNY